MKPMEKETESDSCGKMHLTIKLPAEKWKNIFCLTREHEVEVHHPRE